MNGIFSTLQNRFNKLWILLALNICITQSWGFLNFDKKLYCKSLKIYLQK
jgi:hypothetical protein